MKTIGVLSYQGDFEKHIRMTEPLGVRVCAVRNVTQFERVDALIIPGGESTTIGMLMERFGILTSLLARIELGFPVLGTCAGAILLAREIEASDQVRIGAMDIAVRRNAYGRQVCSFEADLSAAGIALTDAAAEVPMRGVFIRAPRITTTGPQVERLAMFEDDPVIVRQGALLAATFHPELTEDDRLHRYFVQRLVC